MAKDSRTQSGMALWWSFLSVSWMTPLFRRGGRRPVVESDLPALETAMQAATAAAGMDGFWTSARAHAADPQGTQRPSLIVFLLRKYAASLGVLAAVKLLSIAIQLGTPFWLLPQVLKYIADRNDPTLAIRSGVGLAFIFFALQVVLSVINRLEATLALRLQVSITALLTGAVYEKALVLSPAARKAFPEAQTVNMASSDVNQLASFFSWTLTPMWASPLHIIVSIVLLGLLLGHAVWAAVGTLIVLSFAQSLFGSQFSTSIGGYMRALDSRIKLVREFLHGIKMVKFGSTEEVFEARVGKARSEQVKSARLFFTTLTLASAILDIQRILIPVLAFATYAALGGNMQSYVPFAAFGLFETLMMPLNDLPNTIASVTAFNVSYKRVEPFLLSPEVGPEDVTSRQPLQKNRDGPAIAMDGASFTWEEAKTDSEDQNKQEPFKLEDINLSIPRGSLVAVVGSVGSGKSSLLSALI
ncbi:ABC transporter type 1, transmembrane domain-containing protein, partial [Entophlyctis helioformis]